MMAEATHPARLCKPTAPPSEPPKPSLLVPAPCQTQRWTQAPAPAAWHRAGDYPDLSHLPGQVDEVRGEGGGWRGALEHAPRPSPPPAQPFPAEDMPAEGDNAPGSGRPQFQGNNQYVRNAKVTSWDELVTREGPGHHEVSI